MARKIAENCFIKGSSRGLRKSYDDRTEIRDLSGPVTAISRFEFIIPGLDGIIYAVMVEQGDGRVWVAFFLDGTSRNHKGEFDGLWVLEEGEDPSVFLPYFSRPFKKLTPSYWKNQIERLIETFRAGHDDDEEDTLDLSKEAKNVDESSTAR
jgi:hypothetical protein